MVRKLSVHQLYSPTHGIAPNSSLIVRSGTTNVACSFFLESGVMMV